MDLRRLTVTKRAVVAGLLSLLLAFSGVDTRGIAMAIAETSVPVESSQTNEASESASQETAAAEPSQDVVQPEAGEAAEEPEAAEASDCETAEQSGTSELDAGDSADGSEEAAFAEEQANSLRTLAEADGDGLSTTASAGSVSVETLELSWVTQDTKVEEEWLDDENSARLELIPGYSAWSQDYVGDDAALEMQASLHIVLSGEGSCEAGAVQITLPAQFVKDRDGAYLGTVSVDVPEEPDGSQDFAYRMVTPDDGSDPYLLITSMRALDAGSAYDIGITVSGITPHEVKSDAVQSGLKATASVAGAGGSDTVRESNELTAVITTSEHLESAHLNGGTVVEAADAPEAVRTALGTVASAAGKGEDDYVLVRWNAYVNVEGNQAFTLAMEDKLSGANGASTFPAVMDAEGNAVDAAGSVVLGTSTDAADSASDTFEKTLINNGYIPTGETRYETVWTAYPASLFEDGATYQLGNTVTWILTPTDTDQQETLFKSASITYKKPSEVPFEVGTNYYSISKETLEPHTYATSSNTALSELAAGEDATVSFTVTGVGEIMAQTKAADETTPDADIEAFINDGSKTIDDFYHKRFVTVEVADDALYLNGDYTSELGSDDYHVSRVDLHDPYVYAYAVTGTGDAAQWDYVRDTAGRLPDMALYGLSEATGGTAATWTKLATVSYAEDNTRTVDGVADGVVADDDGVTLDASLGITRVKLVSSSKDYDKVQLRYSPSITLHAASTRVQQLVDERFAYSDTPVATLRNDATLLAYHGDAISGTDDDTPAIDPASAQIPESASGEIVALTRSYTPTAAMKRTYALDQLRYGCSMEHSTSLAYLRGAVPHVGVTSTKTMAFYAAADLDATAMQATLHYTAAVHEQSNITSRELYDSFVADGSIVAETSGTWYDLLPAGVEPVISSIALREGDAIEDAYAIKNFRDSGRTLLVVKATLTPAPRYNDAVADDDSGAGYWARGFYDEPQISFDAVYNYANCTEDNEGYDHLVNVIAFESGSDALGDVEGLIGEPDDASERDTYNNKQTAAAVSGVETEMTNLDTSLVDKKPTFVYARSKDRIEISRDATTSTKTVASDSEGVYRAGTGEVANQVNVHISQGYTYRISVSSSSDTSGIVIYDALESYEPSGQDSDSGIAKHTWKGELVSVDISALKDHGADPVVYYSTNESITSATIDEHTALDSTDWLTSAPDDLSEVTAVAVDCTHDVAQNDFTLLPGSPLPVYIHMKAPSGDSPYTLFKTCNPDGSEDDPDNNSHAFNNAYILADGWGASTAYTKVGILPFEVEVSKFWDDGDNQDDKRPASVTVNLLANGSAAVDVDGNEVGPVTLGSAMAGESGYSDEGWTYSFSNLPDADEDGTIRYTVIENVITGSDGGFLYTPSYQRLDDTHLRVVNKRASDTVDVCGTITWNDDDDNAGARPATVMVRLYADGVLVSSKRVAPDSGGAWSYAFTDLPARSDGERIVYTVQQDAIDCYATDYSASKAGSGSTVASDGTIEGSTDIANTYSATGYLAIEKTVEGAKSAASKDASFPFVVELFDSVLKDGDGDDPQPLNGSYPYTIVDADGSVVANGSISTGATLELAAGQRAVIGDIPAGSTYKVTEQLTDGFVLSSSENTSGTVTAGADEEHAVVARFTNSYHSTGSFLLRATKVLDGQRLARHQFPFQAYQVFNEGNDDEYEQLVATASNLAGSLLDAEGKSTGTVSFFRVNVTNDDLDDEGALELLYRIREVIPSGATDNGDGTYTYNGYTYAGNVEQVRVTLVDNGDGTITAIQTPEATSGTSRIKTGDTYTESAFTSNGTATSENAYTASGSLSLVAYKSLIGRAQVAGEFTFDLDALTEGAPTADSMSATNDADGTIAFPAIALAGADVGKTYIYKVTERTGADANVNYSSEPVYLCVDVTDDGTGTLGGTVATVSPQAGAEADKVAAGDPSAFEATGASATITNTLKPGTLTIEKKLAEGVSDDDGTEFTFKVRLIGSQVASTYTYSVSGSSETTTATVTDGVFEVKLSGGQTATIEGIAAGTAYQVLEESTAGWQLDRQTGMSGTIDAGGTSAATFTNTKAGETTTAHLYASKILDGKAPEGGAYRFRLTSVDGTPMPYGAAENVIEVSNNAAGLVDFGPVTYDQEGAYTYGITEVVGSGETIIYDDSSWTATVTVVDADDTDGVALYASVSYAKGEGSASSTAPLFSNTTKPGTLTVTKYGVNVTKANESDEFELAVELLLDGEPVTSATYYIADPDAATSAESSTGIYHIVLKPGQTATFTDLPAGVTYHVSESDQPDGWTQTATSQTHGQVPSGGSVASSTTSTYAATGSLSLRATKSMEVGGLVAGQFGFELLDGDGNVVQSVTNLAPGSDSSVASILFSQIDYDVADLFEDDTDDGIDNPSYSARIYTYTMREVVPDEATNADGITWASANDEQKLAGGFMQEGVIYGSDAESGPLSQAVYVKVEDAGSGTLQVTRVDEEGNAITDLPNYTNTVGTGSLMVYVTAIGTNEATEDTEFKYSITLKSASGQPVSGLYPITYYDADGNKVTKVYTDGDNQGQIIEKVEFSTSGMTEGITNIKSGEYFVIGNLPAGTTYEVVKTDSTYGFTQVASTNAAGTITAKKTVIASFTNAYAVEGEVSLGASVRVEDAKTGAEKGGYTFTFQLYDEDNNLLQTKTSTKTSDGAAGLVTFDPITFTAADAGTEDNPKVHRYRIVEVNDSQKDIVYDTHSGWVNVSVWDDGTDQAAELTMTVTYEHETGKPDEQPETFVNKYLVFTELPMVGGSGLAVPAAIAVIMATALASLVARRKRKRA